MNSKWKLHAAKYVLYGVLMILLYVLQTTPGFLAIFGVKPDFVIPVAVAIAVYEDEFLGGLYGALAGLLCDLGAVTLFGFNAVIITASCVSVGLAVIYLLRPAMINYVLLLFCVLMARGLLDYLLNYYMWGYPGVEQIFWQKILPGIVYTVAASPLLFLLLGKIDRKFGELLDPS